MPLILNGDGSVGPLSSTEVGYLDGVTSAVQTQINSKAPSSGASLTGGASVNGGLVVDNTNNTNIINVGDDLNFVKFHWRNDYNYPYAPAVLRITRTSGGGNAGPIFLIAINGRQDSNGHATSLFYLSIQPIYINNGYSVVASRIAGNSNTRLYQVTNSGANLTLEIYSGIDTGYNDGNEFTVFQLARGQDTDYNFSVVGYSARGGGTQLI